MKTTQDPNTYSNTFFKSFSVLKDPRRTHMGNIKYPLVEILFLVISSVICGHSEYVLIEDFGKNNIDWLRKYFDYENGICSHDVIGKLFQNIDYELFESLYSSWITAHFKLTEQELISIDGKRIRGSYDTYSNKLASHIVSAYLTEESLTLGQVAVDKKSNEITAIPKLLDKINIKDAVVSIDAMGCQKDIAKKIIAEGGDYLLAIKGNQKELHQQIVSLFDINLPFKTHQKEDVGHGRVEKRKATVLSDLRLLDAKEEWRNLNSIIKIETERYCKTQKRTSTQSRYYICSVANITPEKANQYVRQHWAIENNLHWQLDVNFGEDSARKRIGDSEKNFNLILKSALFFLKRDKTNKVSIKRKKIKATYNLEYRELIMEV